MTFQYCFDGSIKKVNNLSVSSPRTWGCFFQSIADEEIAAVFPTHVGVFPIYSRYGVVQACLPHARGGVSEKKSNNTFFKKSSPRTWGCFSSRSAFSGRGQVFPTHVGVFPFRRARLNSPRCLPHARGGVSHLFSMPQLSDGSSPRTWGCFRPESRCRGPCLVFPTHVGVFPIVSLSTSKVMRLPHARGGVSPLWKAPRIRGRSSPRTWGCFYLELRDRKREVVFPTHVGVFLTLRLKVVDVECLPHARGGVSMGRIRSCAQAQSSPRTWGCFRLESHAEALGRVFPTHVGVFLHRR